MTDDAAGASVWPYDVIAEIYDDDMGTNAPERSVPFYVTACNGADQVLELGAGTGRIALALVRAGHRVTAVDRSRPMLDVLERKATEQLTALERLRLDVQHADMRFFDLPGRYGAILCPFSAFNYLLTPDDRTRALDAVRRHLRPDGSFVLDVFAPDPELALAEDGAARFDYRRARPDGTFLERTRAIWRDVAPQINVTERRYRALSASGQELRIFATTSRIRSWHPGELVTELARAGFEVRATSPDFLAPSPEKSPRTIAYVCRVRR